MTLSEFQEKCLRTWNLEPSEDDQMANAAMGLAGEVGETVDMLKKHLFHGHPLDYAKLKKELGDILYYWAVLAYLSESLVTDIMQTNVDKLAKRYPDGFSEERSINREAE